MFQSFETESDRAASAGRVKALRALMAAEGLEGLIIPRTDDYQNEYVPASAERLAFLTGFSGSAGTAVLLREAGALFVDGRYVTQAPLQTDAALFEVLETPEHRPGPWIAARVRRGARIGFDPWTHTRDELATLKTALARAGADLVPLPENPVDRIWSDRPAPPAGRGEIHPLAHAGRSSAEKRAEIASALAEAGADAVVLALPESVCWLLNIRGRDVPHTPLLLARAILRADGEVTLFLDEARADAAFRAHLGAGVTLSPPGSFLAALDGLGASEGKVMVAPGATPVAILDRLTAAGARLVEAPDPCALPRARKNAVELEGIRAAHARDGLALTRFLAWLDRETGRRTVDEIEAVARLEAFRRQTNALEDISFDTISGAGPNGAIVHYRVTRATSRPLGQGELFLVDSGGQYRDGTTDVTRTVAIGTPSAQMRERFTRVLKGHIALAMARFPKGTTGMQLDILARKALWEAGLDYDHGTGHGVGAYLSVHEGPQSISKRPAAPLEPGMIVSNEPGYYKVGAYGIRIENLIAVRAGEVPPGGERAMLSFETLTLAPIDRRLVDPELLSTEERAWLDAYHARVLAMHGPHLSAEDRSWAEAACAPLTPR
ncbi:MAG: aminopeptidase P family protein [Alphaproteobacteria bacterium]|nr:aminopeptidase P family protein [Alphaproteobacteria bacterium]